jgi:hypothetical protein
MKKIILTLMIGLFLIGVNVYAGGNLKVNGALGVGTDPSTVPLEAVSTNQMTVKTTTTIDTDPASVLSGYNITLDDTRASGTSLKGFNALFIDVNHTGLAGGYQQTLQGATYRIDLSGSSTSIPAVRAMLANVAFNGSGNYTIPTLTGIDTSVGELGQSTGTYTITNLNGYRSTQGPANGTGTFNITNAVHFMAQDFANFNGTITNTAGLWLDRQTRGSNNYGIVLDGDGEGSDIVFGDSGGNRPKIYSSGGVLYADDAFGSHSQISPHDPETGEWIYYSKNLKTGKVVKVNMEKLVKAVEKLTGEKFMIETMSEE